MSPAPAATHPGFLAASAHFRDAPRYGLDGLVPFKIHPLKSNPNVMVLEVGLWGVIRLRAFENGISPSHSLAAVVFQWYEQLSGIK